MHRGRAARPGRRRRRVHYNLTITALSVAVALIIGGVELISIVADEAGIRSGPLAAVARLDLNYVGFLLVGLFLVVWIVAGTVWKVGRVEERWGADVS